MATRRPTICVFGARGMMNVSGGVEAHCASLLPRIAERMPDVRIVMLARRRYAAAKRFMNGKVEVHAGYAPRHRYFEAAVHTVRAVFAARFAHRARVAHIHAIGPGLFVPLAKLLGMRVVFTHHSRNYLHTKWNGLARQVLRFGEWSAIRFADRIVVVSPSMADEMRRRFPKRANAISYIPNGATDFADVTPSDVLTRLALTPGKYILAVGRLVPEKGFHDLIAAFAKARPQLRLVIAGRAEFEDAYSKALKSNASPSIIFADLQDRAGLSALYQNAALFVLPSHHEGMPIAALEALSFNTPTLLSDIQANLDLNLPAQNYFKMGDVPALAAQLGADPASLRFDARALMAKHVWDEVARQTGALYEEVLTRRHADAAAAAHK